MKKIYILMACVLLSTACGRNTKLMRPIQASLTSESGKEVVNPNIKMYFGQKPSRYKKTIGTYTSNKKTNAFNKSDEAACEWAFLSAIKSLQDRAVKEGGTAVVDIKSYYDRISMVSKTNYECRAGATVAGVALRGTVVK